MSEATTMSKEQSKEFLRKLPLFSSMRIEDFDWILEMSNVLPIPAGAWLMQEGEMGDALYVILRGEFQVTKATGEHAVVLAVRGRGEIIGEMSLLELKPRSASIRALQDGCVVEIKQSVFMQLLAVNPGAPLAMLQTMILRLRSNECLLQQHQKMAALGTLSAGLAHELNNPAAALQRSSPQLRDAIVQWQEITLAFADLGLDDAQVQKLDDLRAELLTHASTPVRLDPISRSDTESEVQDWLEEHNVDEAWEIAPLLVATGWDADTLDEQIANFATHQVPLIMRWLATGSSVYSLLDEAQTSAGRIAEIVKAVKTYSYLDQAPIQEIDIHAGLENTLVILRHKLKHGITIVRDYAPDLPLIEGYGSELNQVWTNMIDNAVDAMDGKGELTLRTSHQEGRVVVEICDTGSGIPPAIQSRIFDPFFTTKEPGVGTGLGLHISYNIIVHKHHGEIQVKSSTGTQDTSIASSLKQSGTCFKIFLPIQMQ